MKPSERFRHLAVELAWHRYAASLRQGSTPCRADGDSDSQTDNYRDSAQRAEMRYEQVKQVLHQFGVPPSMFVAYRGFGLHVDRLFREYSGETLRARTLDAILRWQSYGCSPDILSTICRQAFALTLH